LGYYHGSGSVEAALPFGGKRRSHAGVSAGGGVKFPIGAINAFADVRYVWISGSEEMIPLIVGVSF